MLATPPDHWVLGALHNTFGMTLLELGRCDDAEPMLIEGHRLLQGKYGDGHPNTKPARSNLHVLYTKRGKPDKAAEFSGAGG